MGLERINYQGFRNLADAELTFADDFNFIIGQNGAGKTNLLEAIFYVGLASSFRVHEERSLIRSDSQFLRVNAVANGKSALVYLDSERKKLMIQGNEVLRMSDFIGWLGITLLSIDDIWIIRGSPAKRRAFLDWTIAKVSPLYCTHVTEYRTIVRQRNKVLQSAHESNDLDLLDILDEQLIKTGNEIYRAREAHLPELKKNIRQIGADLDLENIEMSYESTCPDMRLSQSILRKARQKEMLWGRTSVGPHRDDLLFSMNGHPLKHFASEGEERAAAVSLKLAESEYLYQKTGTRPILLLDEVAAEFDALRKKSLLNVLQGQVFYASTQLPKFTRLEKRRYTVYSVKRGVFEVSAKN